MNKKRNVFFIIVLLITCVFGFSFISFSYYTGVTNEVENINIDKIENELSIEENDTNTIELKPNEMKNIKLIVKSLNPIKTSYKLFYTSETDVSITVNNALPNKIEANEKQIIELTLDNKTNQEAKIDFNIYSNYLGREINGHGEEIKK